SFLVRSYLTRYAAGLAGAAIVGTGIWPGALGTVGLSLARMLSTIRPRKQAMLLNALAFGPYNKPFEHRTLFDWLSRDRSNVDSYIADPLCGFVASNAFFFHLLSGIRAVNEPAAFAVPAQLPLYIASGELDPVGGARAVRAIAQQYQHAGSKQITSHIYPADRHEIFNETDKAQVWSDFSAWLATLTS
ncbi:MAG: alpha/beta hydrolase, partial [Arcanobacterium sp.]|nr:alpha/beta hydrolase [Arcanobacterium sp.]